MAGANASALLFAIMPRIDKYEAQHLRNLKALASRIRRIYDDSLVEIAFKASLYPYAADQFSLAQYPVLKKQIEEEIAKMHGKLYGEAARSIDTSWQLSNRKNDELVDRRLAGKTPSTGGRRILYDPNIEALNSVKVRKKNGLNLSQRVWRTLRPFKKEVEQGLGFMIGEGKPAAEVASELKRNLREPDRLYRRVAVEDGKLKLSRAAREYHPGQGVYRSSFKNALRLTRTETNIAYRSADYERWQQLGFVVGIQIRLSASHKVYDICDPLQGKYPKDFKFTGWHPQCICNAVPIMMTDEEYDKYEDQILSGSKLPNDSINSIDSPPKAFEKYVELHAEQFDRLKTKIYWVTDNIKYVSELVK